MKRLLTIFAAMIFSAQAGYCAGSALENLQTLDDVVNVSVPGSPEKTMAGNKFEAGGGILKSGDIAGTTPFEKVFGGTDAAYSSASEENLFVAVSVIQLIVVGNNGRSWLCSGTMIFEDIALTAAHCVYGAHSITGSGLNGIPFPATMIWYSESYKPTQGPHQGAFDDIDIGMVGFDPHKMPKGFINMPVGTSENLRPGDEVLVAGWGADSPSQLQGAGTLRYTSVKIAGNDASEKKYYLAQKGQGATLGDSGGPVLSKKQGQWQVVGILTAQMGTEAEFGEVDRPENLVFPGWTLLN